MGVVANQRTALDRKLFSKKNQQNGFEGAGVGGNVRDEDDDLSLKKSFA
jgi:hypothetical protein